MKYIAILIGSLVVCATSIAQNTKPSFEDVRSATDKIESLEVAFLTERLDLTAQEAQLFWPIFNDIKEERNNLIIKKKILMKEMYDNYESMTDKQAQGYVDDMFEIETALNESKFEARHRKIIKVIGPRRFFKLKIAEVDFRRQLLRDYRRRNQKKKIP